MGLSPGLDDVRAEAALVALVAAAVRRAEAAEARGEAHEAAAAWAALWELLGGT